MLTQERQVNQINQANADDAAVRVTRRKSVIDSLIASADPYAPPAEDEILRLILSELKGSRNNYIRRPEST